MQEYAAGKDLAEIAREEKSRRGTILRILRTAPFTLLVPESSAQGRPRDLNYSGECFTEASSGSSQRRSDDLNIVNIMNVAERGVHHRSASY
jgi:hypothetical protein